MMTVSFSAERTRSGAWAVLLQVFRLKDANRIGTPDQRLSLAMRHSVEIRGRERYFM